MKMTLLVIGIISAVILLSLLAFKRFYIATDKALRITLQYWDRCTASLAIISFISLGFVFIAEPYFKISTLLFGLFLYLMAKTISGTQLTRWSDATEFDANPNKNIYCRGRFQFRAIKLYFSKSAAQQSGTQYFVICWLKAWGTILMTGVIPELLYLI